MVKITNRQSYQRVLRRHFDPTDECLRKTKQAFFEQIDNLLDKADRPKRNAEAAKLCRAVWRLLQSDEFKATKGCDKFYFELWERFKNTCDQFGEISKGVKASIYKKKFIQKT